MKAICSTAVIISFTIFCWSCSSTQTSTSKAITSNPPEAKKASTGNVKKGEIRGHICYPSDFVVPAMRLYAKDVEGNKIYSLTTKTNDTSYSFKELPEGKYIVYAYTVDSEMQDAEGRKFKGSGGYTYAVPCGLSVECKDQRLIPVDVKFDYTATNIDICDWYDPIVPAE